MKNVWTLALLLFVLSLSSCQRELDEEDLIFRGDWDSKTYALQIYSNGYGVCNSSKWGGLTCEGYVTIRQDKLIFTSNREKSTLPRKRFSIDQRPTIDATGNTFMILNGERFEKR